jgi:hypothetical protein
MTGSRCSATRRHIRTSSIVCWPTVPWPPRGKADAFWIAASARGPSERLVIGMEEAGLTGVRAYPLLSGGPLPRLTSVAYVGFKREGS